MGHALKNDNGMTFGKRWRLVPVDSMNWELCELRESKTKDGDTVTRWMRCGRYYQYNTIGEALHYAIDREAKDGCKDAAIEIREFLSQYCAMIADFERDISALLNEGRRARG